MLQRKACTCLGASEEERLECLQAPSIGLCTVPGGRVSGFDTLT